MNFKTIKKLTSLAAASALIACFCIPAFAAAPTVTSTSTAPKKGDTVKYTITLDDKDPNTAGGLGASVSTSGLKFVGVEGAGNMGSTQNKAVIIPALGGKSITYTYTVTGEPGSKISFTLSNIDGSDVDGNATTRVQGTVSRTATVASEAVTDPTNKPTDPTVPTDPTDKPVAPTDPTNTPNTNAPSEPGTEPTAGPSTNVGNAQNPATTTTASTANSNEKSPKTGDSSILLVFAITSILAATAVTGVAIKKALSK